MAGEAAALKPERHARLRLWLRLFATVSLLEREIQSRLRTQYGMSLAKFDFLSQLDRNPGDAMTMGRLGQRLMVTGGNITGLTDRLEADGLVRREADPDDRRVQQIVMTAEGRVRFAEMAAAHEGWIRDWFAGLSDDEVDLLNTHLSGLRESVARTLNEEIETAGQ